MGKHPRKWVCIALLWLAACMPSASTAQEAMQRISSQGYSREFESQAVSTTVSIAYAGGLSPGGSLTLQVDLDTAVEQGALDLRSGIANGLVEVALPPGLEPGGKIRLSYYDESKSSYQFMYSRDFPALNRLEKLEGAFARAAGSDPEEIFSGLAEVCTALSPSISMPGPAKPEITGAMSDYALTGITWLIPSNVLYKPVADFFDEGSGLQQNVNVRVTIPLTVMDEVTEPIVLYIGGLSTATARTELAVSKLPPTAIPLVPIPKPVDATSKPAESGAGAPAGKPGPVERKPPPPSYGKSKEKAGAGLDTQKPGPAAEDPVIPALVASYGWIAWEVPITPEQLGIDNVQAPEGKHNASVRLGSAGGEIGLDPTLKTEAAANSERLEASTDVVSRDAELGDDAGSLTPSEDADPEETSPGEPQRDPDVAPLLERRTPAKAEPDLRPKPGAKDAKGEGPAESEDAGSTAQESGVKEVMPGTLPGEPEEFVVALKPITGSAGVGKAQPGGSHEDPVDKADNGPITLGGRAGGSSPRGVGAPPPGMDDMVLIPAGEFLLGTADNSSAGDADEQPQESLFLPDYYIDKYPVLNRQFYEFVLSSGYKPEGNWEQNYSPETANSPVRGVTWNDANAFAKWAHKRLPTEAEWEKAARGTDGRTYPWGEEWSSDILPREENLYRVMLADGTQSSYGVVGMVGLVWQWTASAYTSGYPFNPAATGEKRVLRGGAFSNGRNIVRCSNRYAEAPNVPLNTFGFRCVKDAK